MCRLSAPAFKCPWYQRLHRSITFLRERDIALAALREELDDVKAVLAEAGIDLAPVNAVEQRVKENLVSLVEEVGHVLSKDATLSRKDFVLRHQRHPLFGLLMTAYLGRDVNYAEWYEKNRLKQEFSLEVLASGALAEALEG